MELETKPLITEDQFRVSTKIVRDLSRYERKRHIAARIIADQDIILKDLSEYIGDQTVTIRNLHGSIDLADQKISELDIELGDLRERLADRDAVIEEQSDDIENLMGEITALKWVIEKKI